jgi:hypothetical protein
VNGGAIALGHPIGCRGARLALHLALELKRRGGGTGAAALCGGGGQGDALLLRVPRGERPVTRSVPVDELVERGRLFGGWGGRGGEWGTSGGPGAMALEG